MVESLTPKSICTDLANGKIDRSLASDLLLSLIEGSDDHIMRAESIEAFEIVGIKGEKAFKILENSLLSDESQMVRSAALNVVGKFYLSKGIDSINWVVQHDKSPLVLKRLMELSDNLDVFPITLKDSISRIFNRISSELKLIPYETRFILDLEALFSKDLKKSVINVEIYKKFTRLRDLNGNNVWLEIDNKTIKAIRFNFFNWKYLRNNSERIKSISKLKFPDIYLNKLKSYSINENFGVIPESVGNLNNLKILDLSNNNLRELPRSFSSLKQLHELNLSYNDFLTIPCEIFALKTLKTLDLSNNNIQKIPDEIKNLISLKTLLLDENQIHSIPNSLIGYLNSLENFKYL